MSANLNPNLFRLSLPEWLKEQVESGQHKGVFWINEEEKMFHVPWKHASRNGWEDGDVSLFKAWAIYTNRYREGIDKPKPALWKTNFRCAINSHNYITFMKDQGERKGDKAHRIMKLIEQPKDRSKPVENCNISVEPHRKRVRITYPNNDQSKKRARHEESSRVESCDFCKNEDNSNSCSNCSAVNYLKMSENVTPIKNNDHEYLTNPKEHIENQINSSLSNTTKAYSKANYDYRSKKPNLQDLYFVGKALQSIDDSQISFCLKSKKAQIDTCLLKSYVDQIKKEEISDSEEMITMAGQQTDSCHGATNFRSNARKLKKNVTHEEDEELITPRETEICS